MLKLFQWGGKKLGTESQGGDHAKCLAKFFCDVCGFSTQSWAHRTLQVEIKILWFAIVHSFSSQLSFSEWNPVLSEMLESKRPIYSAVGLNSFFTFSCFLAGWTTRATTSSVTQYEIISTNDDFYLFPFLLTKNFWNSCDDITLEISPTPLLLSITVTRVNSCSYNFHVDYSLVLFLNVNFILS